MKLGRLVLILALVLSLAFYGCQGDEVKEEATPKNAQEETLKEEPKEEETQEEETTEATEVEIEDIHGKVMVPKNPEVVVALDNRTFQSLEEWGVKVAAVPKDVMPADSGYVKDESVVNIGNHREPNLELIAASDPDLVIVGQRFAKYYEDIKVLVPNAVVVDFTFDVSEKAEKPGENLVNGFIKSTRELGKIFGKEAEAEATVERFNKSIEDAKAQYNGEDTIMALVVSGGKIGFSAPRSGRVWGPMFEIFGWKPSLEVEDSSSDHKGDDISVEAIAQSNPKWLFVLDRDAAVSSSDSVPAKDVLEGSEALKNTTAIKEGNIVYAPDSTYTNESIQTYTEIFELISEALGAK